MINVVLASHSIIVPPRSDVSLGCDVHKGDGGSDSGIWQYDLDEDKEKT